MKVKQEDIIIIINCILIGILFYIIISTPKSNEKIIKENLNSVVEIENILDETVISKGTGIVIDTKYIITNYHIVKNNDAKVFINNYNATNKEEVDVVAFAEKLDLALLKFNNKKLGLNPIKVCNDKQIIIGSNIITIGNAKGYGLSFNEGLISSPIKSLKIDNLWTENKEIENFEHNKVNPQEFLKEWDSIVKESEIIQQKITTYFKASSDMESDVAEVANKGDFDLMITEMGKSIYEGTLLGKILGLTTRIINPEKLIKTWIIFQ